MTIALWCVLVAALLPYVFVGMAKAHPEFIRGGHNKDPRQYEAGLTGARQRAYWAHENGFEAFPPFAAGVIIAHVTSAPAEQADVLALAFIGCRVLHGLFYVANLDKLRSLAWVGGLGAVLGLFVISAG
jgi:uncharacterized MAPEG superfamily protein